MKLRHLSVLICLWVLTPSCSEGERQQEAIGSIDEYYDVQGLLAANEEALRQMDVSLQKEASFAGEVEESSIRLDSAALAEELDVFREVDINKPVLRGRYHVTTSQEDGRELVTYEADDKESLNINFLKIYRNAESGVVERMEALFSSRNVLYNSTRLLSLQYGEVNGQVLPQYYTVEGVQKMIFSEREEYSIRAEFIY